MSPGSRIRGPKNMGPWRLGPRCVEPWGLRPSKSCALESEAVGSWALESKAKDPCALEPWAEAPGALESGAQEPCAKKSCALELKVQESVQSPGVLGPGGLAYARGGSFCVVHMREKSKRFARSWKRTFSGNRCGFQVLIALFTRAQQAQRKERVRRDARGRFCLPTMRCHDVGLGATVHPLQRLL